MGTSAPLVSGIINYALRVNLMLRS